MRDALFIWRQHLRKWAPPLAVFALALALAVLYRLAFAGEAEFRRQRVQQQSAELAELEREHQRLAELLAKVEGSRAAAESFLTKRLSTEERQLTRVIAEIKKLGRKAELRPSVINYDRQVLERQQLLRRSIVFTVEGDYLALRRLINLIELSDLFLALEEVSLSGDDRGSLRINLRIATYFVEPEAHGQAVAGGAS